MKNLKIFLIYCIFLASSKEIKAQGYCQTPGGPDHLKSIPNLLPKTDGNVIRIFFHVMRETNGTRGYSCSELQKSLDILIEDFRPVDICFELVGIEHVSNSAYLSNLELGDQNNDGKWDNLPNHHADAIDIYFFPRDAIDYAAVPEVVSTSFYVSGTRSGLVMGQSHVLSHEMGHCLGLEHTFLGMCQAGGCPELVDGSNSATCGDYVTDTPADPETGQIYQEIDCTWSGIPCGTDWYTDANGETFNPATNLIMSYADIRCIEVFTPGQGDRMATTIANVPMLQNVVGEPEIDLYGKDLCLDFGQEPNNEPGLIYLSDDMWIRRYPTGFFYQTTENPEYSSTNDPDELNYVYVRVRNRGCEPSLGTETLDLRWSKAATSLSWPEHWNGSMDLDPGTPVALAGDLLATRTIPSIPGGGETILEIPWNPPSPYLYSQVNPDPWHFCLLARIISSTDLIIGEGPNLANNVINNNNIYWKNITVVDNIVPIGPCTEELMKGIGVAVGVADPDGQGGLFDIEFSSPKEDMDKPITQYGTVVIALDNELYQKWVQGGKKGEGIREMKAPSMSATGFLNQNINEHAKVELTKRHAFELTGLKSTFENIYLNPGEVRSTSLMVLYPPSPVDSKTEFKYDIIQRRSGTGELTGGVRYDIKKPENKDVETDAGANVTINKGCSANLKAIPQNECYAYYWLDGQGNVISRESTLAVQPKTTTTYTLKIISSNGIISSDEVTVNVNNTPCFKKGRIDKILPNPAEEHINIKYNLQDVTSAELRFVHITSAVERIIPLNPVSGELGLEIAEFAKGSYLVRLVGDGAVLDMKTLIVH